MFGTSAASHGPSDIARACAMPKRGEWLAHSGAKWMSWQILPPLYILMVFPSSSGNYSSMGLLGQVAGISNCSLNSYLTRLQVAEHTPCHLVPSLLGQILNQSLSLSLLALTQVMMARSYSFSRSFHFSSLGPAWMVSMGMLLDASSIELIMLIIIIDKRQTQGNSCSITTQKHTRRREGVYEVKLEWWCCVQKYRSRVGLNHRPFGQQPSALPTELREQSTLTSLRLLTSLAQRTYSQQNTASASTLKSGSLQSDFDCQSPSTKTEVRTAMIYS